MHKCAKIRWAKHSQFQPYKVFRGNTQFCSALASSVYCLTTAKHSLENFYGMLRNAKTTIRFCVPPYMHIDNRSPPIDMLAIFRKYR